MEFKSHVSIEIKSDRGPYILLMPQGAPIGEAYDKTHQLLEAILTQAQSAVAKAKPKDITETVEVHPEQQPVEVAHAG